MERDQAGQVQPSGCDESRMLIFPLKCLLECIDGRRYAAERSAGISSHDQSLWNVKIITSLKILINKNERGCRIIFR
jgi:hypothetical protein